MQWRSINFLDHSVEVPIPREVTGACQDSLRRVRPRLVHLGMSFLAVGKDTPSPSGRLARLRRAKLGLLDEFWPMLLETSWSRHNPSRLVKLEIKSGAALPALALV